MPRIITVSAPAKRELTSVATDVAETSISPANRACKTIGLALMLMISGSTAYFCSNFFSCSTHTAALAGLAPAQAMRILSCAKAVPMAWRCCHEKHYQKFTDHSCHLLTRSVRYNKYSQSSE